MCFDRRPFSWSITWRLQGSVRHLESGPGQIVLWAFASGNPEVERAFGEVQGRMLEERAQIATCVE